MKEPNGLDEWAEREFGKENVERWAKEKESMRKKLFGKKPESEREIRAREQREREAQQKRAKRRGGYTKERRMPGRERYSYKGEKDFWGAVERGDWAAAAKAMGREWE